ncbi:Crp/Fnr family transcriptional regulator [Castellaniella sp.]|uniref:Crp/Fnr family transcriptional regulator n=1 Tax=Castellaniella sp. TaxID=1955812 RepID=UPI002AFF6235|nr:Crp/Fnr family transcriptional regulator [Castellaniella sp.]
MLLSSLSEEDWSLVSRHLFRMEMKAGDIMQKAGDEVMQTWFPCDAASASFQISTDDGRNAIDVATIGREGAIGGIVSNGRVPAYASAGVRNGGMFLSIRTAHLENVKSQSISLRHWFARYSDYLVAQLFQNSACNATHTIRQRAARWLLDTAHRTGTNEVVLTHEQLATMLGVGRTFVTRTVKELRDSGLVMTRRGTFMLPDPMALRAVSCDCSDHIATHFNMVMSGIYPASSGAHI